MNEINSRTPTLRVTIKTVAQDAGVSVAAVSKVMRNAYGVSDSLRQKVTASIERLGYRPSVAARGMRGQTYTIGILLVEISNPFIPEVVDGITGVLEPSNYKAMFGIGHSATSIETGLVESMIDNRMDGLILVAPRMTGDTLARYARQIPMVAIGHHEASALEFDTVNCDDQRGVAIAVEAFVACGHRDIAMLSNEDPEASPANVVYQRERAYLAAMQACGLSETARILMLPRREDPHLPAIDALLKMPDRPRALFVWSDLDAILVINAAKAAGIRVPQDLAIIGYDNSPVAALPLISLSSIDQSGRQLGEIAVQALLSRIGGRKEPLHHLIVPKLLQRDSS